MPIFANVGVFTGYGHSIELTSSKQIKMVREEVTIIPGRGRFQFDGGVAGMDRVEYDCKFELKNLSDKKAKIQVGFPLNSQFMNPPYSRDKKVENLVAQYRFLVQEEERIYSLRYASGDKTKKLKNLFLWDLNFEAGETKHIRVSYVMPISMTLASSNKDGMLHEDKQNWTEILESCVLEYFGYVTETGKSWSGTIDEAKFRVYTKGFDDYLLNRPAVEGITEEEKKDYLKKLTAWNPTVCRIIEPEGWKMSDKGFYELQIKNYKAEKNLSFMYYLLVIPQNVEDARRLIKKANLNSSQCKDLADIVREFNGEKTGNKNIKKFLSNQVWYGVKPLRKIPKEVISYIENYNNGKPNE